MHDWFQKHEQYCTEVVGPWQTRKCYPWEYEAEAQKLIQKANTLPRYYYEESWCRQQAKILQNRADYIRQAEKQAKEEAEKQAEQAKQEFDERWNQLQASIKTLQASMQANLQLLATQTTQQSAQHSTPPTPPAPQEAPKEEANDQESTEITAEKQEQQPLHQKEQQPLYQATVEDDTETTTESTTKHGNSMLTNKSTLSSFSCLCTTRFSRDRAARLSNAPLFACQKATFLISSLTSFFDSFSASRFGYIRCMASMEASGEG